VQRRLDENPKAMRVRRETVEHPFGTIKVRMRISGSKAIRTFDRVLANPPFSLKRLGATKPGATAIHLGVTDSAVHRNLMAI
jgi:16S rRNA G1207 methylase RsmC